jgi:5-methylcytosine-specific restriction endonuclease McrA
MRIELWLILITSAIVFHIHTDGKYTKNILMHKKYIQMGGVVFGAFVLYILIKKNPANAQNILVTSNEYLKYLPVDKNTSSMISPILDFTSKHSFKSNDYDGNNQLVRIPNNQTRNAERILHSGRKSTKRSVSETKKKFVASRQKWNCGECNEQLNAWFEVDHKIRLEYGGSNHVDNLVALCRECHGKKTTIENL